MHRPVVHFEIGSSDLNASAAFYEAVFGWKLQRQGTAAIVGTGEGGGLSGHLNQLGPNDPQAYVTVYLETDALREDLVAIATHGGEVVVQPVRLPDGREFAWFRDVAGNLMGLITAS